MPERSAVKLRLAKGPSNKALGWRKGSCEKAFKMDSFIGKEMRSLFTFEELAHNHPYETK
jgi:hypothetical protein